MRQVSGLSARRCLTGAAVIVLMALVWVVPAWAARPEPENVPDPRTRAFPHIDWCKDYEGGKPRVLFIANGGSAWEVYALASRMDLDYDVFYTNGGRVGLFGPETDYYHEGIRSFADGVKELKELLEKDWDVIALVDMAPYCLPAELHCLIVKKAVDGAGVVTFNQNQWQTNFAYPGVRVEKVEDIFASAPRSGLTLPQFKLKDKVSVDQRGIVLSDSFEDVTEPYVFQPLVVRRLGKGCIIDFMVGGGNYFGGPALHPAARQDPEEILQSEYFYALAAKVVLMAAGREPKVRLAALDADGKTFEPGKPFEISGRLTAAFTGKARVVVRTHRNLLRLDAAVPVELAGAGDAKLALPALPAGRYYVDVWLLHGGKTVDWASAYFIVRSPTTRIAECTLANASSAPNERLQAIVTVNGATAKATLTARIWDAFDRILVEQAGIALRNGRAEIALPLNRTREQYHVLEVCAVEGDLAVDAQRRQFYVNRPWDEDLVIFTDGDNRNLLGKLRYDIFREYGVTTVEIGSDGGGGMDPRLPMSCGMRIAFRIWLTHCYPYTGGCIASDTYQKDLRRTFRETAASLMPYGLTFLSTGDDSGTDADFCDNCPIWVRSYIVKMTQKYKGDHRKYCEEHGLGAGWGEFRHMAWNAKLKDIQGIKMLPGDLDTLKECWKENYGTIEAFNRASGTAFKGFDEVTEADVKKLNYVSPCLLGYRDAMKARYKDIKALNAAWGTQVGSFEEITNELIEGLVTQGKYGAKLDKTWYMEDLFVQNMTAAADGLRDVSPDVGIGQGAASFGNVIPEVLEHLDSAIPYKGDRDFEIIRSVPHRYCGQTIGVYGGKKVAAPARENQAWETLFTGGNFIWFWSMCTGGLEGDLSMNPCRSGVMLDNIREMQGGIARALIRAKRQHDGIAILHERRAGMFAKLANELGTVESSQVGFQRIIEDLGMQYRYTWTKEVEAGVLRGGEFKVLILPYTQILSDKEVAEVRSFVQNGGAVIADLRVATHDWNGRPLDAGRLDDVFGIRQDCAKAVTVKGALQWTRGADGQLLPQAAAVPGIRGDASVQAAAATALGKLGGAPAVLVNSFGKGRAILLNQSPTTYNMLLNRGEAARLRALYRALFALAGAERRFKVQYEDGMDVSGAEIAVFRNGPVQYLTIEKESYQFETYPIKGSIQLDRQYEVYDVRAGRKIGYVDRVPVSLKGLGCYVYTLLPYRVTGFVADCPTKVKRGDEATVSVRLTVEGGPPGPHTVRVDIYRPGGARLWPMYKTEMKDGKASVALPVAFNEEPGAWKVVVTDVTTGQSVTKTLQVGE